MHCKDAIDLHCTVLYSNFMKKNLATQTKAQFNLRIDSALIMNTKILAARQKTRPNQLVEEALIDLLKKYKTKASAG